jgi:hypothetical protein
MTYHRTPYRTAADPMQRDLFTTQAKFDGPVYEARFDQARLTGQILRVFGLMSDARWRTLREIEDTTNDPAASVSAQLRHLRKQRFGAHTVEKRARGERVTGLWEYRLIVNKGD